MFEIAIEFIGGRLPDLEIADRVLDLDGAGVRALVGRDVDLAPVVLDISFGVVGIGFELHQQSSALSPMRSTRWEPPAP